MYRQLRQPNRSILKLAQICADFSIAERSLNRNANTTRRSPKHRPPEAGEPLAQLVERLTFNQDVESSNLSGLTNFFNDLDSFS